MLVNLFSSWIFLQYWLLYVKQQSINKRRYSINLIVFILFNDFAGFPDLFYFTSVVRRVDFDWLPSLVDFYVCFMLIRDYNYTLHESKQLHCILVQLLIVASILSTHICRVWVGLFPQEINQIQRSFWNTSFSSENQSETHVSLYHSPGYSFQPVFNKV